MIKLIITDLDGTLVHHHKDIRDEDIAAMREAAGKGVAFAVASGRMQPEIAAITERLGIGAHAISQNGAYVHLEDGGLLRSHAFGRGLALELLEALAATGHQPMLAGPDRYAVERLTPHAEKLRGRLLAPLDEIPDVRERLGTSFACGKMSLFGELEALKRTRLELAERFGGTIDTYVSDIDCVDFMPAGVSKGAGVRALLERLSLRPEEAACIGDSFNDLSMFAETPNSFAMAGSHADVRARAARTVRGVAEAVAWALDEARSGSR